jgi:diguanylate cyclase
VSAPTTPSEIARETIRQLAARRIPPTPDSYAALYTEIAGNEEGAGGLTALRLLERIALDLVNRGAPRGLDLQRALGKRNWALAQSIVQEFAAAPAPAPDGENWPDLLRNLLRQLEARHTGATAARKREAVEHILTAFGQDPAKAAQRLRGLLKSWGEGAPIAAPAPVADAVPSPDGEVAGALRDLLVEALDAAIVHGLLGGTTLAADAQTVVDRARNVRAAPDVGALTKAMRDLRLRIEMSGENPADLARSVYALLGLVTDNLGELVESDQWVSGQVAALRELLAGPLTRRNVADAERALRGVLFRQMLAKQSLDKAKETLKALLANFVVRLGAMAEATNDYHRRLGDYSQRIVASRDLGELSDVVGALERDTRAVQTDLVRTRDELERARTEAAEHEARVRSLERELAETSALVREDVLTLALNRRGLNEAFAVEAARSDRERRSLAVALLDVDNFKQLNDRLGHAAGDDALKHLASVIRQSLRPTDSIARYGGEEFVILLPNTGLDEAAAVMARVQRELTRRFFLHNNERLLITFSAGVTLRRSGDDEAATLARADEAMLRAKREGKNRVVAGDPVPVA